MTPKTKEELNNMGWTDLRLLAGKLMDRVRAKEDQIVYQGEVLKAYRNLTGIAPSEVIQSEENEVPYEGVKKVRDQVELMKGTHSTPLALPFELADRTDAEFIFRVPVVESTQTARFEFVCVWTGPNLAGATHPIPDNWEVYPVEPKLRQVRVWKKKA